MRKVPVTVGVFPTPEDMINALDRYRAFIGDNQLFAQVYLDPPLSERGVAHWIKPWIQIIYQFERVVRRNAQGLAFAQQVGASQPVHASEDSWVDSISFRNAGEKLPGLNQMNDGLRGVRAVLPGRTAKQGLGARAAKQGGMARADQSFQVRRELSIPGRHTTTVSLSTHSST